MTNINNDFDFSRYDIGGKNTTAGDGKLTGAEVKRAQVDGWNIWDGMLKDTTPEKFSKASETVTFKDGTNVKMSDIIDDVNCKTGAKLEYWKVFNEVANEKKILFTI